MSDYASQIVAARMNTVNAKLSTRMNEITSKSGIPFSDIFAARIYETAKAQTENIDTSDAENQVYTEDTETVEEVPAVKTYNRSDYDSLIYETANRYGLSSALVRAVVWAESNFNPLAVSEAGALGLMQLMPDTASALGVSDAFDVTENLNAGAQLLADKIMKYGGDVRMALASYNCGDGGLSSRDITDLTDYEQMSKLPGETQSYLSRIEGYLESVGLSFSDLQ